MQGRVQQNSLGAVALGLILSANAWASGHGPVFGMTTPTNVKGGWSFDLGLMGRAGIGNNDAMVRGMLGYGITEDIQVSLSVPYSFNAASFAPARISC
ncbi:MAG: hypothetical protein J0H49_03220 [Acidobacteria bacterium]|nr:hypothetical protein [Acidobacteriota bacterium]